MATVARSLPPLPATDVLSGTPRAHVADRWIYVFTASSFVAITLTGFVPDSIAKIATVDSGARPPFPLVMHLHAVLTGSYLLMLLAQTWLAATGRLAWHMKLGVLAAAMVPAIVIVGFMLAPTVYDEAWAAYRVAAPDARGHIDAILWRKENILLVQIRMGVLFPLLVAIGLFARRRDAGLHKRMMILAAVVVLPPAINRILWLPTTFPQSFAATELYMLLAVSPMFIWDAIRNGYVHKAYWIWLAASLPFVVAVHGLWDTPSWHVVARQLLGAPIPG